MEVVIPTQSSMDFDFTSAVTSPNASAPSTPRRFGDYFFSAPTSPARMSEFYREFEEFSISVNDVYGDGSSSATKEAVQDHEAEFAFAFSLDLERTSLSADELFDGGKIKPLEPPQMGGAGVAATKSSASPKQKVDLDKTQKRGRDRTPAALSSSSRRAARSLSPLRVSQYPWEEEEEDQKRLLQKEDNNKHQRSNFALAAKDQSSPSSSSSNKSSSSRKWSLKDLLLFRSASEGRATDKDPLRRYTVTPLNKKRQDDVVKNASFRSTDGAGGSRRRRGPVSAHELHYNRKRAAAEDLKKKTYLPYKQSILGRLSFTPAVHALANGFGALTRA